MAMRTQECTVRVRLVFSDHSEVTEELVIKATCTDNGTHTAVDQMRKKHSDKIVIGCYPKFVKWSDHY